MKLFYCFTSYDRMIYGLVEITSNIADPYARQTSVNSPSDKPYVVHCVGVEKEADLAPAFTVSLQLILSHHNRCISFVFSLFPCHRQCMRAVIGCMCDFVCVSVCVCFYVQSKRKTA